MKALFGLSLRRGLRDRPTLAALALFGLLLLLRGRGDLARQELYTALWLLLLPCTILRGAAKGESWRSGEGDWLGSRPIGRLPVIALTFAGTATALALWLAAGSAAIELCAGGASRPSLRIGSLPLPAARRLEPNRGLRLQLDAPPTQEDDLLRLRLRPTLGGAPMSRVRLTLARGGEGRESETTVTTGRWIELPTPPGDGALWLELDNLGEGALAWPDGGAIELWRKTSRSAAPALWSRALAAGSALLALALGAGLWMRPGPAFGAALASLPLGIELGSPSWWPGCDLAGTLTIVGEGRLPSPAAATLLAGTLAWVAAGLVTARLGLRSWRHVT